MLLIEIGTRSKNKVAMLKQTRSRLARIFIFSLWSMSQTAAFRCNVCHTCIRLVEFDLGCFQRLKKETRHGMVLTFHTSSGAMYYQKSVPSENWRLRLADSQP